MGRTIDGVRYGDAVQRMHPYHRIVQPLPHMRADTIKLVQQAANENRQVYVLVNNRAEVSAPLTVRRSSTSLIAQLAQ